MFGRPLLRLPTFRQSQATVLTAEPLLLEEPQHAASPADGAPVTDAGPQQSSGLSELSLPLTPRDPAPAELASAFATPPPDGHPAVEDDQAARLPAEVAVLASAGPADSAQFEDREGSSAAAAPDEPQPAEEECSSATAANEAGLEQPRSTAEQAPDTAAEPPQQSGQPLSVQVSSSSGSQPESPGTPAQAAELPRVSVVVRYSCRLIRTCVRLGSGAALCRRKYLLQHSASTACVLVATSSRFSPLLSLCCLSHHRLTGVSGCPIAQGSDGRPTAERLQDPVMARFLVPQPVAGFLIGTGGARTKQYSERSGAKVWVAGQQFVDVPGMRYVFALWPSSPLT